MNQEERLDCLVHAFIKENPDSAPASVPTSEAEKRALLSALMYGRKPLPLSQELLDVQNEYLSGICNEKGIVQPSDIPRIAEIGSVHPFGSRIAIWQGDITRLACDAIVNAADPSMPGCSAPGHACVDHAIHTCAGVQLRLACFEQMERLKAEHGRDYRQPVGVPLITPAYNLPSMTVIHVAGPLVSGEVGTKEETELTLCYSNALDLCRERCLRTIAFPCIAAGKGRFPARRAAEIAVKTVTDWIRENREDIDLVIFDVFTDADRTHYEDLLFDVS